MLSSNRYFITNLRDASARNFDRRRMLEFTRLFRMRRGGMAGAQSAAGAGNESAWDEDVETPQGLAIGAALTGPDVNPFADWCDGVSKSPSADP